MDMFFIQVKFLYHFPFDTSAQAMCRVTFCNKPSINKCINKSTLHKNRVKISKSIIRKNDRIFWNKN